PPADAVAQTEAPSEGAADATTDGAAAVAETPASDTAPADVAAKNDAAPAPAAPLAAAARSETPAQRGKKGAGKTRTDSGRPPGATGDGGFVATPEMMSILGCSADELGDVLKALGFRSERRAKPESERKQPARKAETTTSGTEQVATPEASTAAAAGPAQTSASAPAAETASASQIDSASEASAPATEPQAVAETDTTGTADASAVFGDAPQKSTAAAEADDDANFMTVWRPRRRNEFSDRGPRHRRPRDAGAGGPRGRTGSGGPRDGAAEDRAASGERGGGRPGNDRGRNSKRHAGPGGGSSPQGNKRDGGKRDGGKRAGGGKPGGHRHDGGGRGQRGPKVISAGPKRSDNRPAADSPFAALSALKETLERSPSDK
ncbi:MAG: hypothetical protein AAGG99_05985, partial [Pseudomonadota bacterium]